MYQLYNKLCDLFMYIKVGEVGERRYPIKSKIGLIGGGNITKTIVTGMTEAKVTSPDLIIVFAPTGSDLRFWKSRGVSTTSDISEVIRKCEIVVLAMDPRHLDDTLKSFDLKVSNRLFISIMEGISVGRINEKLRVYYGNREAPEPWRIIRVVPGVGVTSCVVGPRATPEDVNIAKIMFPGQFEVVPERSAEAIGALSASTAAFVYLVIEAMCDGAVAVGLSRALASRLACQTVIGGATMVQKTGRHPGELRADVWDLKGVHVLERSGVRAALIEAIEAATSRAIEIGQDTTPKS